MMQPTQIEMLVAAAVQDRRRDAARHHPMRPHAVGTWRRHAGALLVRTGLAVQGTRSTGAAGPRQAPCLAAGPCC